MTMTLNINKQKLMEMQICCRDSRVKTPQKFENL